MNDMKDEEKFRRNRELELKRGRICVLVAPESDFLYGKEVFAQRL